MSVDVIGPETKPVPSRAVASRTIAGRGVVIDTRDDAIHQLNPVATFLWEHITKRTYTVRGLAEAMTTAFEVDQATAESDVSEFVQDLYGKGFVDLLREEG